jgi:LmbE family N-acetylglucosaminyl deacetylase
MNVLCIAAHPDDETLGCGGTLARLAAEGHNIFIAILGEGLTSRVAAREDADRMALEELHQDARKASGLLGAKDLFLSRLPDNRFDTVPLLDVVKIIEGLVEKVHPQVIYTQHGGDLNIDHVITFRATLTAARALAGTSVREVLAYEVPSSTETAFQQFTPVFLPDTFVDITTSLEKKIAAMQAYRSERRTMPHPRSPEMLRAWAAYRGAAAGANAAEAFVTVRRVV